MQLNVSNVNNDAFYISLAATPSVAAMTLVREETLHVKCDSKTDRPTRIDHTKEMQKINLLLIEVLKDRYEYEQFRKNNFDNVIGIPITVLSLLVGGLAAFVFRETEIHFWVRIGSLIGMVPIAITMFHLVRVFFGLKRKYDVLPNGIVIREQYEKLIQYHEARDSGDSPEGREDKTIASFQEDLAEWYTKCNLINCEINDLRAEHFHYAKLWLIISISAIFILLIFQILLDL